MIYKTDKINSEITINNRIVPREYLTEISKYETNLINNKQNLEKN